MAARPKSIADLVDVARDAVDVAHDVARGAVDAALDVVDTAVDVTRDAIEVTCEAVETVVDAARGPENQRRARMGIVMAVCLAACAGMPADLGVGPTTPLGGTGAGDAMAALARAAALATAPIGPEAITSDSLAAAIAAIDEATADAADAADRVTLGLDRFRRGANLLAYQARTGGTREVAAWAHAGARRLIALLDRIGISDLTPATLADFSVLAVEPVTGAESSGFGPRWDPFTGDRKFHKGLDFRADRGTPVMAAGPGKVIKAGALGGYGNIVIIEHGMGLTTRYGHLSKIDAKEGAFVAAGDQIGRVGATGRATGPHLHWEVRQHGEAINPYLAMQLAEEARSDTERRIVDTGRWMGDPVAAAMIASAAATR